MSRMLSALLIAALLTLAPQSSQAADGSWIGNVGFSNQTFYPRVPDDFKDTTEFTWTTADTDFEACWASVYRPDGSLLMDENTPTNWQTQFEYMCDQRAGNWFVWNGLNKDGQAVPTGTYEIKVKYYDIYDYAEGSQEQNVVHTLTRRVTVATGIKWFKERLSFRGASFDKASTRGNCRVYRLSGDAVLDCWDGRYAQVMYDIYVQYDLDIKDFRWNVSGEWGCCAPGTVKKTATRNRGDLKIRVNVNGWRSYDVYRVGVSWLAKNRI